MWYCAGKLRGHMTVKTKRVAKKIAKNGAWAISDIFFLGLKAIGTLLLILITTGVVFSCIFLVYLRNNLTSDLDINPKEFTMSLSSVIYCVDPETGREIDLVTLQSSEFRRWVDYKEIPEHLINALVAIEDHRFFSHHGVDWYRTAGAFMNMFLSMRDTFGGSTITQQLIKNMTHEDDVTVQRKLLEIFRALEYENQYDKEEILELYLNLVYFGHGCYGIGAAAHYYFNKEVSELTLAESATIVSITNNPSMYSPYANREANTTRKERILNRMYLLGYIDSEEELQKVLKAPVVFQRGEDEEYEQVVYDWFEEAVIRDVIKDLVERGYAEQLARRKLYTGGLRIQATIDLNIQEIVDNIYQNPESLPKVTGSAQQLQSGIVIADPYTGEIKALSGGVGSKTRNMLLNRATMTRRPPGSSLKPLSAYAPAMDAGDLGPDTLYDDSNYVRLKGTNWMPKNADRSYSGIVNVRTAIIRSLNTIPAIVIDKLGVSASYRFMRDDLGFALHPSDEAYAPLAAGQLTYGATVREMASAFTIFPNGGERVELRTYSRVYDDQGAILIDNTPKYNRAVSEWTAYWMTSMLYDAATRGTGSSANLGSHMPTAGKTGTSTDSKDRWFVGFTPYYVAAVWTGYDTPATMRSSGNPAAQIWKMIMAPIHENLEKRDFQPAPNIPRPRAPGGVVAAYYYIRCIDTFGNVLYEEEKRVAVDQDVIVYAPSFDGYYNISASEVYLTVTNDASRNVAVFTYQWDSPITTVEPDDPDDPNIVDPDSPNDPDNGYLYSPDNPYIPDPPDEPTNPAPDPQPDPQPSPDEPNDPANQPPETEGD